MSRNSPNIRAARRRAVAGAIAGPVLALIVAAAAPAAAQGDGVSEQNGIAYACTGTGESKFDPRWKSFALKLVYAVEPTGGLLSGVRSQIVDRAGNPVLDVFCEDEPWLMAALPPGRYRVRATALGRFVREATIVVGANRQTYVVVRFPHEAGQVEPTGQ